MTGIMVDGDSIDKSSKYMHCSKSGGLTFESCTLLLECLARSRSVRLTTSGSGWEDFPIVVMD